MTLYLGEYEYNREKKKGVRLKLPSAVSGEVMPPKQTGARSPDPKGNHKPPFDDEIPPF